MRWIECIDELPPENKLVLCYSSRSPEYFVGFFSPICGWMGAHGGVKICCTKWFDGPIGIEEEAKLITCAMKQLFDDEDESLQKFLKVFPYPNQNTSE